MTAPLTPEAEAQLRVLCKQATAGPLKAVRGADDDENRWIVVVDGPLQYHVATIENGQPGDCLETEGATAKLFAASRNALPALLDELAALRSRCEQAEETLKTAISLGRQATNGWACYARTKLEHDDISRLHRELESAAEALRALEGK